MTARIDFALNRMATPRFDCRALLDLAAAPGWAGIALCDDLAGKGLTQAVFFDGEPRERIAA